MAVSVGNVKIVDNSKQILQMSAKSKKQALIEIASAWDKNVVGNIPVDTGYLRNSRGYEVDEDKVTVGFSALYSGFVELGTSRQRAQPYLKPSVENYINEYKQIVKKNYENT